MASTETKGGSADAPSTRGEWLRELWGSTVGKKIIVATTGFILFGYIVLHVLGNLKALQGDGSGGAPLDDYSHWLRTFGSPVVPRDGVLWLVRLILLSALVLHIAATVSLSRRNQAARSAPAPRVASTLSSRTMMATGLLLLAFIVFHILQFTTRTIQITPVYDGTVYANVDAAFQKWYFVLLYVAAVVFLGFHLRHAIWSVTQTMGWDKPNRNPTIRRFATVLTAAITIGFAAIPVCFYLDVLPDPPSSPTVAQLR